MSVVESLRATLRNVADSAKLEIEFGLPPNVKFALDGKAINAMQKTSQIISYELMMCFTDRQIFYDDLEYIDFSDLPKKFREAEDEFKQAAKYVFENGDPGRIHLAELFTACVPIIADHRRVIERAPDPESVKRTAGREIPQMRSEVVPYMETLAAFLPSASVTEERLVACIAQARASMTPEQLEASEPRVRASS
jgi:hypothetical protein